MTASEQAAAKNGPVTQVPVALGGEGVVYNLSLPAGARLHLTGPVLAAIFLGQVTRWNDPAITALNAGVSLPPAPINVVHRADGSGTTYIFSNYLSSVDPAWATKVGTGKTLRWPVGEGADGNSGVASRGQPDRVLHRLRRAGLLPRAAPAVRRHPQPRPATTSSRPPRPSPPTPPRNRASHRLTSPSSASPAPTATPSAGTAGSSWTPASTARPPARHWSPCSDWLTHDGQAYATANGYVPLPAQIQQLALDHAPADHRPCCRPPSQLTSVSRAARCPGQDNLSAPNESQPVSWLGKMRPCRNGRTPSRERFSCCSVISQDRPR